jgi:hypothetical protein
MSNLNKKNGNLRGVKLSHTTEDVEDWAFLKLPVQGWIVDGKNGHRFDINFEVDGRRAEIVLTQEALYNMINAILEADNVPITGWYPSVWAGDVTGI